MPSKGPSISSRSHRITSSPLIIIAHCCISTLRHVLKEQRYILRRPFIMNNLICLIWLCLIVIVSLSHLELLVLCPIGTAIRSTVSNFGLLRAAGDLFDLLEK